jgi:hypothetical protein
MAQVEMMIMACTDKAGQRVWAVQSTSQTKKNGFPKFHLVTWDFEAASWVCPCPARKPCIHMKFASEASKREQERIDAAFDALTAKPEIEVADKATQDEARQARINKLEAAIVRWRECELTHIDYYQDMVDNLEALNAGAAYKQVTFDMEEVMLAAGRVFGAIANNSAHDVKRHNPPKTEPIIARRDTGPRLFREPLAERVREVM